MEKVLIPRSDFSYIVILLDISSAILTQPHISFIVEQFFQRINHFLPVAIAIEADVEPVEKTIGIDFKR